MNKLIFFLLISSQLFGQKINFSGKLLDLDTKEPVVYANISFLNSNKGISSQENGAFNLLIDKKYLESKIHISCLNYKDTIVNAKDLHKNTLFLKPISEVLEEIILTKKIERSVTLDEVKKKVEAVHTSGMRMIAKYFPSSKKTECCNYISTIEIHFSKRHSKQSKFRFRIFNKDEKTGLPKDDLLKVNLPLVLKEGELKLTVNLEAYDIEMPKDGLFVAFEKLFIPFNEYGEDVNNPEAETYYSPVVGFTKYPKKKENMLYLYVKGKWQKSPLTKIKHFKKYAPAISVTLTN
tara:strand:- start:1634 stop:2512 length:879 start_codon:yes stop_codon:yes gene_type:complete